MFIKIKDLKVHYQVSGAGENLVLVHGWGCNISHYARLQKHLAKKFCVYAIDLPGFGLRSEPEEVWNAAIYADFVANFIRTMKIENPVLVGHSLGGKISANLAARHLVPVNKLVLISSAGIKPARSLKTRLRIYAYKTCKMIARLPLLKIFLEPKLDAYRMKAGSTDYRNSSGIMRAILVRIVNEDIRKVLPQIEAPTLLIWGEKDTSAPLAGGKLMHELIYNSELRIIPGCGHFPHLDNHAFVANIMDKFLINAYDQDHKEFDEDFSAEVVEEAIVAKASELEKENNKSGV